MEIENGDFKSKLEDYEVIENIGRGAFGAAYLVLHKTVNKKFVLKKIRLSKFTDKFKNKACHEINLIAKLRHPYILEYKDAWVEKGSCICVVTNYCENGNISDIMRKTRRSHFPEEKLCKWLTQMLLALDYLHSNRVLHRDLKMSNIFITKENDIRIGDFGLGKLLNEDGLASSVAGTPNYMCPELFEDTPYGYKSDIWSLGCCMFEIAARQQAFRAPDMAGLINKINRSLISPMPIVYSSYLKQIIKSMLRKSPEHRPTAAELLRHSHLQPFLLRCQNPSTVFLPVKSPLPSDAKDKTVKSSPCCAGGCSKESKDNKRGGTKLKQQRDLLPLFEENNGDTTHYLNLLDDDDISIEDHLETKRVDPTSYFGKISIDGDDSNIVENKGNLVISLLKESFHAMDASILPAHAPSEEQDKLSLEQITKSENAEIESEKKIVAEPMGGPQVTENTVDNVSVELIKTKKEVDNKGNLVISLLEEGFHATGASILPSNAPSEEQERHFLEQITKSENAEIESEKTIVAEPMGGLHVTENTVDNVSVELIKTKKEVDNKGILVISSLEESFHATDASILLSNSPPEEKHSLEQITKSKNAEIECVKTIDAEPMGGPHVTEDTVNISIEPTQTKQELDSQGNLVISSLKESFRSPDASILPSNAPSEEQEKHSLEQITKSEDAEIESEKTIAAETMGGTHTTEDTVDNVSMELIKTKKEVETRLASQEPSENPSLNSKAGVVVDKSKRQQENPRLEKADALESLLELCADLLKHDKFDELNGVLKPFSDDVVSSRETAISLTRSLMNAQKKFAKES